MMQLNSLDKMGQDHLARAKDGDPRLALMD
jgi:hypothetical protein